MDALFAEGNFGMARRNTYKDLVPGRSGETSRAREGARDKRLEKGQPTTRKLMTLITCPSIGRAGESLAIKIIYEYAKMTVSDKNSSVAFCRRLK